MFRCADDAPSGGIIGAAVSASVHYIRRESGRCLTRALRVGAGVNQLRESKTETRRTGGERVWNWGRVGGPTTTWSKRTDERRRKLFEKTTVRRRGGASTNGQANRWN